MAHFQWQTEEEADWQETVGAEDGGRPRRPLLLFAALVLLLLAAGANVVYRRLDRRVEEAASGVEEQVLASHEVVRYAAEQGDREVLTTFLSGRDRAWAAAQEQLLDAGALFDRRGLRLRLLPAGAPESGEDGRLVVKEVALSPDLMAADVVVEQAYAVGVGHGLTETVWLEQSSVYRLGPNRWLYAPREDEAAFWGPWSTVSGRFLTLSFPERDAQFAQRLASDLEARLARLCNLPDLSCPADYHLTVTLDSDPSSLLVVSEPSPLSVVDEKGDVRLPAPSLVGRPVDDAAYRALTRGYAVNVLGVALTRDIWEWTCCERSLLFQAILDEQLRRLDVQVHPLLPADYKRLARERFELSDDLEVVWREPRFLVGGDLWRRAHATVAFIAQQKPNTSPTTMVAQLNTASNGWQWLYEVANVPEAESPEWLRFLHEQAGLTTTKPPVAWPEQEGLLLCWKPEESAMDLYRYEPMANRLVEASTGEVLVAMQPLPKQSGVLLFARGAGNGGKLRLDLWRGGERIPLWESEDANGPVTYNWSAVDPVGERMVLSVTGRDGESVLLLDLEVCLAGACRARELPGRLLWSPDGKRSLIVQENALLLADGGGRSPRTVVTGTVMSPVWLDNETFGYLRGEGAALGSTSLFAVSLGGGQRPVVPRTLLRMEEVRPSLPDGLKAVRLGSVEANPVRREQLLLYLIDVTSDHLAKYVVFFNWKTGALDQPLGVDRWQTPVFSPNGRWLVAHGYDPESDHNFLTLRRLGSERKMSLPQYSWPNISRWSRDGGWLLNASGPVVRAIAPDYGFERVLVHEVENCFDVAWVDSADR